VGPLAPPVAPFLRHLQSLGATPAETCDGGGGGGGAMGQHSAGLPARSWGTVVGTLVALGGGGEVGTSRAARTMRRRSSEDGGTAVPPQRRRRPVADVYTSIRGCNMKPLSLLPMT
jgi:hypothetical protein